MDEETQNSLEEGDGVGRKERGERRGEERYMKKLTKTLYHSETLGLADRAYESHD